LATKIIQIATLRPASSGHQRRHFFINSDSWRLSPPSDDWNIGDAFYVTIVDKKKQIGFAQKVS